MPMIHVPGETVPGLLAPMHRANLGFWTEKFYKFDCEAHDEVTLQP